MACDSYLSLKVKPAFLLVLVVLCYATLGTGAVTSSSFRIGGLFNDQTEKNSQLVYEQIVKSRSSFHGDAIHPQVNDSYSTALEVCANTQKEQRKSVVALIDARPTFGECDNTCLLCSKLQIPHLAVGWQPHDTEYNNAFTLFYHPPPELISKAYVALIKAMQWDKFAFLYESEDGFIRIQEVINTWPIDQEPILYRQLDPNGDNREIFKDIFKVERMANHILDCEVQNIKMYMEQIVEVEKSTSYQSFIFTALDAYTINLRDVPAFMANVSTLHFTSSEDARWQDLGMDSTDSRLETALTADALDHLEKSLSVLIPDVEEVRRTSIPSLCFDEEPWDDYGQRLKEALLSTTTFGFTGNIEFDEEGKRKNFNISYSKLSSEMNFSYAGFWDSRTEQITNLNEVLERSSAKSDSPLRIASLLQEPYFMLKKSPEDDVLYEGYAVDLIEKIFAHMKEVQGQDRKVEFYRVTSGGQGNSIEGTKKWSGLIGELLDLKADLAVGDITITSDRNAVVDFSVPFMSLGISILVKEEPPPTPDMFSFIKPLSVDVWLYLATVYILVSFVLLICARMCDDDWVNPHPCNQNPENLQNIWTLYNCMWLTMGSIMTQGCDILPRAAGSRWITGVWWFFALIVTSSYTANMSTFLSNSRRSNDVTNVKQLSEQTKIAYGAVFNSSTYKFFKKSNDSVYTKIFTVMESARPSVFTKDNDEGTRRVLNSKGKYAFFMESAAIEYVTQRNCSLKSIGNQLDSKEYGIAFPKKSPHKMYVDNAILSLQESGELDNLKKKWWETKLCDKDEAVEDDGSLKMENTSGIFVVLGMGGILGLFVAVIDFLINASKIAVQEKITFKEAVMSEWYASLDPRSLHKSAAPMRSVPNSVSASPQRERSQSRAVSVLRAATSFINFDEIY